MQNQINISRQNDADSLTGKGTNRPFKIFGVIFIVVIYSIGTLYLGFKLGQYSLQISPNTGNRVEQVSQTIIPKRLTYFQDILNKSCKSYDNFSGIELEKLPIKLNTDKIKIIYKYEKQGVFLCWQIPNNSSYVSIRYTDNLLEDSENLLNIYDENSEELGHGGYPYLKQVGKTIKSNDYIKLNIYLNVSEIGTAIGRSGVMLRGEKTLTLPNGETIFVNTTREIIRADDPQLITLLKKYAQNPKEPFTTEKEKIVDDREGAETEIINIFFGDPQNMRATELGKIVFIEELLSSMSVTQ